MDNLEADYKTEMILQRYIYTCLNPITRRIFNEADDAILNYLDDDGRFVEQYYIPIIPFVLVNGISGIGTGFSTKIPYNPNGY
jgi:DNA topoisomerase-2